MMDIIIVGGIILVAAAYVVYRLFMKPSCGCASGCGCSSQRNLGTIEDHRSNCGGSGGSCSCGK